MRANAAQFVQDWTGERRERAEKDTFWNEFFEIMGIRRRRIGATFEFAAKRYSTGNTGFVDLLWPGYIGVEHKSAGHDLGAAMDQLVDYLPSVADIDLPQLLVVCDFTTFVVRDVDARTEVTFPLEELPQRIETFAFLAGYDRGHVATDNAEEANFQATELLAQVHDAMEAIGYPDHQVRILLVRLLYVLFADDTGVWASNLFEDYINVHTAADGSDLGLRLNELFEILDTDEGDRLHNIDATLAEFPHVNGGLFLERLRSWSGTAEVREALLKACRFHWSKISPVVFGSLFQNVMTPVERRQLGAHFTSERDIMRVIRPLFLDALEAELERARTAREARMRKLREFHSRIAELTFLDPAAGVGNFLLLTFRELRRLEQEVLLAIRDADPRWHESSRALDIETMIKVNPGQFYGIEIEEFPARIAETAMHLVDHLANVELSAAFGTYYVRLPIAETAHVQVGNALEIDWASVVAPDDCDYVLGNPPFVGISQRNAAQTEELQRVWGAGYHGTLDYVTGWYRKAIDYIGARDIRLALVSTNSITQGEQVSPLWNPVFGAGLQIDFAHQTFKWRSEARGAAQVDVVVIGLAQAINVVRPSLFEYANPSGDPVERIVQSISPYLVDGPSLAVQPRRAPFSALLPAVAYGNKPVDNGGFIIEADQIEQFRADPVAFKYVRRYIGARELIHNTPRWCLWLNDLQPGDLGRSALLRERVGIVKDFRDASDAAATREYGRPTLFRQIAQPSTRYLAIPIHVSENREFYLSEYFEPDVITSNANFLAPDPDGLAFAVLSSSMFIAWQRAVGGRLTSRLRFNKLLTWNTFPLGTLKPVQRQQIIDAGAAVRAARALYPDASLAELYQVGGIPTPLSDAHRALDRVVDPILAPRARVRTNDDRLRALLKRYAELLQANQLATPSAARSTRRRPLTSAATAMPE